MTKQINIPQGTRTVRPKPHPLVRLGAFVAGGLTALVFGVIALAIVVLCVKAGVALLEILGSSLNI